MEMAFRVLLSLTQDDASWCQAFLEDELTLPFIMRIIMKSHAQRCSALSNRRVAEVAPQVEDDNDAQILDRLCLALGLLTNLVQISDMAKDLTRNIRKSGLLGCHPCDLGWLLDVNYKLLYWQAQLDILYVAMKRRGIRKTYGTGEALLSLWRAVNCHLTFMTFHLIVVGETTIRVNSDRVFQFSFHLHRRRCRVTNNLDCVSKDRGHSRVTCTAGK